jgi:hypothetical protein
LAAVHGGFLEVDAGEVTFESVCEQTRSLVNEDKEERQGKRT